MANKRISDLPVTTTSVVGDVLPIDGTSTRKITVENFLAPNLVAIKGLTSAADKGFQFTGTGTAATYDLTTAGKALLDDADAAAQRATLGLVIGTDVQAQDADLAALAANSTDGLWAHTGAGTGAARTLTAPAAGITITNPAGIAGNPTLVLANDLAAVEGLASTGIARRTGTDAWSVGTAVSNAELAAMAAYTIKGNATGSSAVPTDIDITALTAKASPVSADIVLIQDSAASNAFKKTTVGALASAGSVGSFNSLTGAITTSVVVQKFTASGTYTPTAGMLHAIIECVGGGGGGGGAQGSGSLLLFSAGGGGSGGYSRKAVTAADVGASKTVTIGGAGAGATAGANSGTAGTATSVGTLCIANGGGGGGPASSVSGAPVGGIGGTANTGDIASAGAPGGAGVSVAATFSSGNIQIASGLGGSSVFGGGALGNTNGNGVAAGAYGSGGSGGCSFNNTTAFAGGAGSAGLVVITEFVNL